MDLSSLIIQDIYCSKETKTAKLMRAGRGNQVNVTGYSRRQSGSTLVELQSLMTLEYNRDCDDGGIMEKEQENDSIQSQDDENKAKYIDSDCTATDKEENKETVEKRVSGDTSKGSSDFNEVSLYTNNRTDDAILNDESLVAHLKNENRTSDLEMRFESSSYEDCSINRTKNEEENCRQRSKDVVELDLADLHVSSNLEKTVSISLDTKSNCDISENTSTDSESTNRSVSISLSDHLESTQGFQDRDVDLEGDACRICHCGNETEVLISPCLCTGTVKHIHHSCLMDWLKRCMKTKCELCLQNFSIHRKTKPLKKWRRPDQKPTPIIWLLTFIVALTLNIASIAKDGSQKCVSNPCIIFYVVGALGAMLGFAFFYHWLIVSIRYIKQWMALNEEWTLVGSDNVRNLGNANLAVSNKSIETKEQRNRVEIV